MNSSSQIEKSSMNLSGNSTDSLNFVYKKMPDLNLFNFGQNTPNGERCYHVYTTSKDTQAQLCRIGKDTTSPPVYFLFGDSLSIVMSNVFNELDTPGMFTGIL